jgi:hypothetical protein
MATSDPRPNLDFGELYYTAYMTATLRREISTQLSDTWIIGHIRRDAVYSTRIARNVYMLEDISVNASSNLCSTAGITTATRLHRTMGSEAIQL